MRKIFPILLLLMLLSACEAPPNIATTISEPPIVSAAPTYPQFHVYDTASLDGLNLDGVGEDDDNALAIQYCMEDDSSERSVAFTLLQVTLGTGETWVEKYDGFQFSELSTGYLTNKERVCVVLQLISRTSNYSSTDVHVLELWENPQKDGAFDLAECLTLLDGDTGHDRPSNPYPFLFRIPNPNYHGEDSYSKYLSTITFGNSVVDLPNSHLQGLEVMTYATMQEDVGRVLRWDGAQWYVDGAERRTLATISLDGPTSDMPVPEARETTSVVSDLNGDGTEEQLVFSKIGSGSYCSLTFQRNGAQYRANVLELMQAQFPAWQSLRAEGQVSGDENNSWLDFRYWLDGDQTQYGCRVAFTGDSLVVTE